jgi:hypothetical protein
MLGTRQGSEGKVEYWHSERAKPQDLVGMFLSTLVLGIWDLLVRSRFVLGPLKVAAAVMLR